MSAVKLHPLDDKIIEILQQSGRVPVRKLAQDVGLSETAARYRLNKLLESGLLVVVAQIEPGFVGRPVNVFVKLELDGDTQTGINEFKAVDGIDFAALQQSTKAGGARILAHATYPSHDDLLRVRSALWTLPDVTKVEVGLGLEIHSLRPRYWGSPGPNQTDTDWVRQPHPRQLEAVDHIILRELARDGRMQFTELAEHTGLSTAATRQRYLKLVEDGALRVRALPDPYRLGITGHGEIAVKMRGTTADLVERLVELPTTRFVVEVAGPYDLLVVQVCRERQELLDLVEREIATDPNVDSWDLSFYDENLLPYTPPLAR